MSENTGAIYKIRWEILLMAATLITAAAIVVGLPHNFTAKMLQEQKEQRAAEQQENLETTLEEKVGLSEGAQGNTTATNVTGTNP